jgi:hypothetical protein
MKTYYTRAFVFLTLIAAGANSFLIGRVHAYRAPGAQVTKSRSATLKPIATKSTQVCHAHLLSTKRSYIDILLCFSYPRRVYWNTYCCSGYEDLVQAHTSAIMDSSELCVCSCMDFIVWAHGCICFEDRKSRSSG